MVYQHYLTSVDSGLNRTSVGLKLWLRIDVAEAQEPSLNRTSVGLKRFT